jgi:hypothetical protein
MFFSTRDQLQNAADLHKASIMPLCHPQTTLFKVSSRQKTSGLFQHN